MTSEDVGAVQIPVRNGMDDVRVRERCYRLCGTKLGSCLQKGVDPTKCETFNNGRGLGRCHQGDLDHIENW